MDTGYFYKCPETLWLDIGNRREIELKAGELVMVVNDGIWVGALHYECDTTVIRTWEMTGAGTRNDYLDLINRIVVVRQTTGDEPTTTAAYDLMLAHGVRFKKSR